MTKLISAIAAATALIATSAVAQTTMPDSTSPSVPSTTTAPSVTLPTSAELTMTDAQAKNWIDKAVYSSDDKNVGEVGALQRDATGKVTELHADIGGFLGIGETRVRLMPTQFRLVNDRVILNLTAEQAKSLPKIAN